MVRSTAWYGVGYLVRKKIIPKRKVVSLLDKFFELLKSDDEEISQSAWESLSTFGFSKIITRRDASKFIEILNSDDQKVLVEAWGHINDFIWTNIIPKRKIASSSDKIIELLKSDDEEIRKMAKDIVDDLVARNIIEIDDSMTLRAMD